MDFPLLVFTDLDGTLLDHQTYSFYGAEEALQLLRQHAIPIILTSSKTKAELLSLQRLLGLNEPFIAENGGGIFVPAGYAMFDTSTFEKFDQYQGKQFGRPYSYIRMIFEKIRSKYNIKGFGDMNVGEIMDATGLEKTDAILAGQRNFSEPFLFLAEPRLQELRAEVAGHGLTVTSGGRFYHLMSAGQDKGRAVTETARLYQAACTVKIFTVGLGDAENDYSMLKNVDIPVLIPKHNGSFATFALQRLRKAPYPGSKGWGAAMTEILFEFARPEINED